MLLGVMTMFKICCYVKNICNYTPSPNITSRGSLMRLYNRLLVWLDTILMVVIIQKQHILSVMIIPNNICYCKFALKSLPGVVPYQALPLAVGMAEHHPGGHGH